MFQAVMIEDDETTRGFLAEQLQKAFSEHHEELHISGYESGEAFLRTMGDAYHYDILFLDIEMKGMDGITLAGRIRRILPQALLVFISSQEQLVFRSFEVQPFRFIRKQDFSADLSRLTEALLEKLRSENRRMIVLTEPGTGDLYSFDINDLLPFWGFFFDLRLIADMNHISTFCCNIGREVSHSRADTCTQNQNDSQNSKKYISFFER